VSAFAKLASFQPRFLLESVEGGERLARYSFIGFGECLELRLDSTGLRIGAETAPRPTDQAAALRAASKALRPEAGGFRRHGGSSASQVTICATRASAGGRRRPTTA
jgi:anthranilate/para-aminobenzoate synthase component I